MCLINLKKNQKKLVSLLSMLVVELKRKPKNISRSSFTCWELSRVNSFYFFSFLWGSRRLYWKCLVALICMIVYLTSSPYYLSSLELNACRFQLRPMHMHSYYYTHRSVVQVKGNNDDYMMNLLRWEKMVWTRPLLFFVNMISSSFLIQPIMNKYVCNDN